MKPIDFRSDTITRPSPEMRRAMYEAEVGDDVLGDDPTVKELEHYVAGLFEREASLFVPSGTMGNQICLKVLGNPGWELLCDRECHVVNYEVAGPVIHAGLLVNMITTDKGMLTADVVRSMIRPKSLHTPETRLVTLENTHNRHGGTVLPQDEIVKVREVCNEFDLRFHLDGARIWNAHVATGLSLPELTRPFDSVSVCLSKGLGAPIGSLILGSAGFVARCLRERKLFGGGMRQVGIIAAAGLHAVKHNIPRLKEDHQNARLLAESIDRLDGLRVDLDRVQTNIVVIRIEDNRTSAEICETWEQSGVRAFPFGPKKIRIVTHLDVSRDDCLAALDRIGAPVAG